MTIDEIRWALARIVQPSVRQLEARVARLEAWAADQDEALNREFERGFAGGHAEARSSDLADADDEEKA